ncbi:unnamed protein product [Phytophthora lilii]|uniref:Unnamed protein product n=1 Tax=Phytophthora lilii TaxID=2077276 RepID=A0A9W6WYX9_9STRA|nr:unnamed protein product [Phytophthora lilii]
MLRAGRSEGAGDVHDCVVPPPLQEISCEQPSGTTDMETIDETKKKKAAVSSAAAVLPTKVLFLDGIRGLAAMLVVLQHSKEYMNDVN